MSPPRGREAFHTAHGPGRRRREALWIASIAIVVSSLLLIGVSYVSLRAISRFKGIEITQENDWPLEGDPLLGFSPAPNSSTLRRHLRTGLRYHVHTDHLKARVNSLDEATPGEVAILVSGCSFAWGYGVENEDTFSQIAATSLGVSSANVAYHSYGTVQALQTIERSIALKPRVIVYAFIVDHLRRNLSPRSSSPFPYMYLSHVVIDEAGSPSIAPPVMVYPERLARRFYDDVITGESLLKDIYWGARIEFTRLRTISQTRYEDDEASRKIAMRFLLTRMSELAHASNASLIVMYIPSLRRQNTDRPPEALTSSLPDGVIFLDLAPVIRQHYADSASPSLYIEGDGHPNRDGHVLFARELVNAIRAHDLDLSID